jgi:hypothetical protein
MTLTLVSGTDLLSRKDARVLGGLCSDNGNPVSETAVATHPKVITALEDAEGEVIGTLAALGRYSSDGLAAVTGAGASFLKRIICEIAMINLLGRRPDTSAEDIEKHEKIREAWLKRLQEGSIILADPATEDAQNEAARPSVDGASLGQFRALGLIRHHSNYFPTPRLPDGRNY